MLSSATLTNTLVPDLTFSVVLSALSRSVSTLLGVNLTLQHMSTIRSPFSSQRITSNFSSVLIVLTHFSNKNRHCRGRNYDETCLYSSNELELYQQTAWHVLSANYDSTMPQAHYTSRKILLFELFMTVEVVAVGKSAFSIASGSTTSSICI